MAAIRVGKHFWVPVVGIEIHAKINSLSKLFSASSNATPKSAANSQIALFDVSMPGSLPRVNEYCVKAAVKTALALGLRVNKTSLFDRKHYFYADLPAGYQITQQRIPLAVGGSLEYPIYSPDAYGFSPLKYETARFDRIQLEHDSAKTLTVDGTILIDSNRCGSPLMEIVTKPDFQFGYQVSNFVKEISLILKALDVCDCKFNKGSFRVDSSVSVHRLDTVPKRAKLPSNLFEVPNKPNSFLERHVISIDCEMERDLRNLETTALDQTQHRGGTIVEIKNINSFKFLREAIDYEILRQIEIYESTHQNSAEGKTLVENETRAYSSSAPRKTISMRDKTKVHDYRFLPETNLPPLSLKETPNDDSVESPVVISEIAKSVGKLPRHQRDLLCHENNLSSHSFGILVEHDLLPLFDHLINTSKVNDPNTLVKHVFFNCVHKSRPPLSTKQFWQIAPFLPELANLKHDGFLDDTHILSCVFWLLNESRTLPEPSSLKDVLTQQCWFVSHSAKETRSLFDKFYQTNLSNFKAVTSELQSDVSVYDLEANAKHRKLKKKFAKQEINEMEKAPSFRGYTNELTSEIIDIRRTRSYVALCGCQFSDIPKLKKVVLLIPGNPGCITFYENFILSLYSKLGIPVVGISHAYHQRESLTGSWSSRLFLTDVYNLQQQIQHKIDFIDDYFDQNTEVLLIGHSIGAYICLKMMQHSRNSGNLNKNFAHSFLLMPTVERMRVSPKGQKMVLFLKHLRYLVMFLHMILTSILPDFVIRDVFAKNDPDCIQRGAKSLCATRCFNNVFYMAANELEVVDQLDKELIQESLSSATFYYTPGDHWAPESYGEELKARFPKADVIIGTDGMTHEFVRTQSEEMAQILCQMMIQRKMFLPEETI